MARPSKTLQRRKDHALEERTERRRAPWPALSAPSLRAVGGGGDGISNIAPTPGPPDPPPIYRG
jgi:hypothetical protein